jgi:hypothetical protein
VAIRPPSQFSSPANLSDHLLRHPDYFFGHQFERAFDKPRSSARSPQSPPLRHLRTPLPKASFGAVSATKLQEFLITWSPITRPTHPGPVLLDVGCIPGCNIFFALRLVENVLQTAGDEPGGG